MRFTINLATKTYINHRLVNSVIAGSVLVLLLILAWNAKRLFTSIGDRDRLKADISRYEGQLNSLPAGVSSQEYQRMQNSIRFYNGIIGRKTADWLGLLDKLEKATPPGVALTLFAPDPKSREIKLEGEARSFATVRVYLEKLEESKAFSNIQLLSHQEKAAGEKSKGVNFAISCQVVPQ